MAQIRLPRPPRVPNKSSRSYHGQSWLPAETWWRADKDPKENLGVLRGCQSILASIRHSFRVNSSGLPHQTFARSFVRSWRFFLSLGFRQFTCQKIKKHSLSHYVNYTPVIKFCQQFRNGSTPCDHPMVYILYMSYTNNPNTP